MQIHYIKIRIIFNQIKIKTLKSMKTKQIVVTSMVLLSIFTTTHCSNKDKTTDNLKKIELQYTEKEFYAYCANSVSMWKNIVESFNSELSQSSDDTLKLYRATRAEYGLLNACIGNHDEETFNIYIEKIEENIERLMKMNVNPAELYAMQAGIYSYKMVFDPSKGMTLGPKSGKAISKAISIDNEEPSAWLQKAGSKFHTPKQFGGNIPESIELYNKTIVLYESNENMLKYNWQYVNAMVWLGIAYNSTEQFSESENVFNKVMQTAPDHGWVKYILLPQTKSKTKIRLQ